MKKVTLVASLLLAGLCSSVTYADESLDKVLKSDFRQAKNASRDVYRHPAETLTFFGITPKQTVIELWPGNGWYSEILGPYLAKEGRYIAASFETAPATDTPGNRYRANAGTKYAAWMTANKDVMGNAKIVTFDPPHKMDLGADGSADLVLTFRNLHNWASTDQLENVFAASYKVLKDGGIFGVVEHRANEGMNFSTGYMDQAAMVALAKKAGFTLVESAEINANPKDTKDYAKGVWTLPPSFALGDTDKEKYQAIGESDRMTLKFVKKSS
ncbi:methyltransferase [Shewanella sp. NKUCC05_KAH]|jgi:predicted methyltransferase|uniref:class I SAM-dependent methyltransferase n=1 Tax=Shewanella TaxID=22 RepID=UPI000CF67D7C|nr:MULTISPECIES: class I SAM-dependent methyltransferase [unclassified Shewanella]AVI67610.1 methyltransferase [Shewanella sp. WE21]MBW3525398.1 methyltransferase [Shewanella sp. NKUCC05_KAH]